MCTTVGERGGETAGKGERRRERKIRGDNWKAKRERYLGEVLYGDALGEMRGLILTHCYLFSSTSWGVCGCVCGGGEV